MTSFLSQALLGRLHPRSSYLDPPCIFDFPPTNPPTYPPTHPLRAIKTLSAEPLRSEQSLAYLEIWRGGWWLGVSIKLFSYPIHRRAARDYSMMGLPCPTPSPADLPMPNQMNTVEIFIETPPWSSNYLVSCYFCSNTWKKKKVCQCVA